MLNRKTVFNVVYAMALFTLATTAVQLLYAFFTYLFMWQFGEGAWWGLNLMLILVIAMAAAVIFFAVLRLIGKTLVPKLYEYVILLAVAVVFLFLPFCIQDNALLNTVLSALCMTMTPHVLIILAFIFADDRMGGDNKPDAQPAPAEETVTEEATAEEPSAE